MGKQLREDYLYTMNESGDGWLAGLCMYGMNCHPWMSLSISSILAHGKPTTLPT